MKYQFFAFLFLVSVFLSGCATWSTDSVDKTYAEPYEAKVETDPRKIIVTDKEADRKHIVLGDIEVTIHKTTIFHPNPTRDMVDEKLRKKASKLGADAVVLVRYGKVGIGGWSWGQLQGRGRAIKYVGEIK